MFTKMLVAVASIVLLPAAAEVPAPSTAPQDIDLNVLNCGDFIKSDPEAARRIMFWLAGYYTYEDDTAIIAIGKLDGKERQLRQYCADNQSLSVLSASEIFMDKKFNN
jgi:hypothetical protein